VSLGEDKFGAVKSSTTNSLFVKNLAIAVWGSETLRDSSLEGKTCPRFKDRPAKQRLETDKLLAVKGTSNKLLPSTFQIWIGLIHKCIFACRVYNIKRSGELY